MRAERAGVAPAGPAHPGEENLEDLEHLLRRVARGDEAAFAAVYQQMAAAIYGLAQTTLDNADWAEEVATEALAEIWRTASQYRPAQAGSAQSWVMTIARQHVANRVRTARAVQQRPAAARRDDSEANLPGAAALGESGLVRGPERQTVMLALYGGYTSKEIGELLGMAPETVAAFIRDGLQVASREASSPHSVGSVALFDRLAVVAAPYEIDIVTADQLRLDLLATVISGYDLVVVDLTRSRFCDCAGLDILRRAHQRARAEGGELRLLLPPDGVIPYIFTLTGLNLVIPHFTHLTDVLDPPPR